MSRRTSERPSDRRTEGFTLVETLIAAALFSVVITGIYVLYTTMQSTLSRGELKSGLQQNARVGIDAMIREIRLAGYQAYCDPVTAGAAMFEFEADTDLSGKPERIIYKLDTENKLLLRASSGDLTASIGCTSYDTTATANNLYQTVASNVTSLNFSYYDSSNGPAAVPGAVRRMTIQLTVSAATPAQGGAARSVPITSDVRLRNAGLKK